MSEIYLRIPKLYYEKDISVTILKDSLSLDKLGVCSDCGKFFRDINFSCHGKYQKQTIPNVLGYFSSRDTFWRCDYKNGEEKLTDKWNIFD